jgi:hypothetical protein
VVNRHSLRLRLEALAERLPILCPRLLHRGARLHEATRRPVGDNRWLTVVSPESPDGPELLLEPSDHPAVKPYRDALVEDGIPLAQFAVDDVEAEHARLTSNGVVFTQPPTDIGTAVVAVLDDTCGNPIQLIEEKPDENHDDAR